MPKRLSKLTENPRQYLISALAKNVPNLFLIFFNQARSQFAYQPEREICHGPNPKTARRDCPRFSMLNRTSGGSQSMPGIAITEPQTPCRPNLAVQVSDGNINKSDSIPEYGHQNVPSEHCQVFSDSESEKRSGRSGVAQPTSEFSDGPEQGGRQPMRASAKPETRTPCRPHLAVQVSDSHQKLWESFLCERLSSLVSTMHPCRPHPAYVWFGNSRAVTCRNSELFKVAGATCYAPKIVASLQNPPGETGSVFASYLVNLGKPAQRCPRSFPLSVVSFGGADRVAKVKNDITPALSRQRSRGNTGCVYTHPYFFSMLKNSQTGCIACTRNADHVRKILSIGSVGTGSDGTGPVWQLEQIRKKFPSETNNHGMAFRSWSVSPSIFALPKGGTA